MQQDSAKLNKKFFHGHDRLASERARFWPSQQLAADFFGVSRVTWGLCERGKATPSGDVLAGLAARGADVLYILTGARATASASVATKESETSELNNLDFVLVPRHDVAASAGNGAVIHDEQIVDHLAFKREWLTQIMGCAPDKVCVIQVRGDSMTPTINDADLLLLDMRVVNQRSEGVYVIQLQGSLLVKRLRFKINGAVDVISDNQRYGTETLTSKEAEQLTVLGRVVWHGSKF